MNFKYLGLVLLPFMLSCGGDAESTSKDDNGEVSSEILKTDTVLDEGTNVTLFDMHPEPNIEAVVINEMEWPQLKYFNGKIGNETISMFLKPVYQDDNNFNGRYIYLNNGSSFEITATISNSRDSIKIVRLKDNKPREIFSAACDDKCTAMTGVWIKNGDSTAFELTEQVNTPQQVQLFINTNKHGDFYNTESGIAIGELYSGNEAFNSFTYTDSEGSAGDFGEEWGDYGYQVFFEDSIIVCVQTNLINTTSTIFKEGMEPDDGVTPPDAVEGIEYSIYGDIIITVIESGVKTSDTIKVDKDFTADTWLFKNYIVLSDNESDQVVIYKWHRGKAIFEKQ